MWAVVYCSTACWHAVALAPTSIAIYNLISPYLLRVRYMLASLVIAFGVFSFAGYLPTFWLKLRAVDIPAPAFPFSSLLGQPTVGLVTTFTLAACIAAADTGAYFVGKSLGRTKLTEISPKKTVEGALGGMFSSVAVSLLLSQLLNWPASALAAAAFGVLVFFSSIFGDLIESIMKRDAEMKVNISFVGRLAVCLQSAPHVLGSLTAPCVT